MKTLEERIAELERVMKLLDGQMLETKREGIHAMALNIAMMKMLVATASRVSGVDAETLRSRILKLAALEEQALLEKVEDVSPSYAALLDDRSPDDVSTGSADD